jgi:tetratricopeptide (TPR) repeat protein
MSAKKRVRLAVGAAAVAAAGIVAGIVLATRQDPAQPTAQCGHAPAAVIVPGVGTPQTAAAVREAFRHWPGGTLTRLGALAQQHRGDPTIQLNYGLALECRGYFADAAQAFAVAKRSGRDTQVEIDADQLLHPRFFQNGYPAFEPTSHDPLLIRGSLEQREGHQHSAERLYAKAAQLRPNDPEALTAQAVGLFDEDNLNASFSRLGPLTRRFPRSQTVRYHLGLMLVWIGEAKQGIAEFRLAQQLGPDTTLGRQAGQILARIQSGSDRSRK